jgi:hypothetical protein
VWVGLDENFTPKLLGLTLNQVSGLHSVEVVLVGDLNELVIASTPRSLVSSEGEIWVALFTVLSDDLAVVVGVLDEELLGVFAARIDVDLSKCVVESWFLNSLLVSGLEPSSQHAELASLVEVVNQFWDRGDTD